MQSDRRKHRRFKVRDNAFAVINPDPVEMVPIFDISMGGLGIYVDDRAKWMDKSPKLELMAADCSFYLDNLPYEIITNFKSFPWDASHMLDGRRYGLKFGNLGSVQKSRLKYFMRNYTRGGSKLQFLRRFGKLLPPTWTNKYSEHSCNLGIWQSLH